MNSLPESRSARRTFLGQTVLSGVALAGLTSRLSAASPSESALRVGLIGAGERGTFLLGELLSAAERLNVRLIGVADVWSRNREAAANRVRERQGTTPRTFARYGELLAMPDLDAVIIATPDFSHGTLLNASLAANKDVYIEKPMTIDMESANRALDAARERQRVVQVGTQRRSEGRFRAAAKFLADRPLGAISRVTAEVNFNQARWLRKTEDCVAADVDWEAFRLHLPDRPFDAALLRRWQLYRETSNGMSGLWMTHYADAVHLLTGAAYPSRAVALGGTYVWKDGRQHTDTFHTVLEYPEGFLFSWGMGLGNGVGTSFTVHGTKGTLDVEKWAVTPEPGAGATLTVREIPAGEGESHMENWLRCLRTRERPNADIQFGHQHVVATMMAAMALETGQRQVYDRDRRVIRAG
ncbi:MAG: Gfo/Idh/MocA family oxidoreductase [Verrucomicrobiales bacterium]|nr:Gfo/Idh/MocA family oxidoreductase [Verrucomicrobiales bacterium]